MKVLHIEIADQERDFFLSLGGHPATFVSIKLHLLQERYDDHGDQAQLNRCNNISERFVFNTEQETRFTKFLTQNSGLFLR